MSREEAIRRIRAWNLDPDDMEVLSEVIPELRESEDERIRTLLVALVQWAKTFNQSGLDPNTANKMISYLEKQKDAFENGRQLGIMQEQARQELEWTDEKQKEHQNNSDAPNESSEEGLISSSRKDKNLDEIAQDYVDNVKECNPEPTWDLMQTAVCYGYHYCEQQEQKPAWSEEDEANLDYLIDFCNSYNNGRKPVLTESVARSLSNWLYRVRSGEILLPKTEGDFGDEWDRGFRCGIEKGEIVGKNKALATLSKQEWSEKDEAIFNKALDAVYYQDCNDKQDVLYALKGLCDLISKKRKVIPVCQRWKPSEEQMKALNKRAGQHDVLRSLYNDLLKLK